PAAMPASQGQTLAAVSMPAADSSAVSGFAPQTAPPAAKPVVVFSGVPAFAEGQAVLFDSTSSKDPLPESGALTRLELRFPGGAPEPGGIDPGLCLLVFVDDLSQPRARVRLADLIRQGGDRPLNISRRSGQRVQVLLVDPSGAWASAVPAIEVALG